MASTSLSVGVGPVMPGWGSWDWVGNFLVQELGGAFRTSVFQAGEIPTTDLVIIVKHAPSTAWVEKVRRCSAIVYCPIDFYGDPGAIERDSVWLRHCAAVVVHCQRLKPYFASLAETVYLDHPLKFATSLRRSFRSEGSLLWVGVRSNLPPLVDWVNHHPLPVPLDVLTNPETPGQIPTPEELGFSPSNTIRIHGWSRERHLSFTTSARAVLDIKGDDFRSQHKPAAKALDFVASGVPLAMNPNSSPAEHLASLGLRVASPLELDRWFSEPYWKETCRCGERIREHLAPQNVARRFQTFLESVAESVPRAGPWLQASANSDTAPQPETPLRTPLAGQEVGPTPGRPARENGEALRLYHLARDLALNGDGENARGSLRSLEQGGLEPGLHALVRNDLGAISAATGDWIEARQSFEQALKLNSECQSAAINLALLRDALDTPLSAPTSANAAREPADSTQSSLTRVAVVSLLFNWPSTGGGNVHSAELTKFLAESGYEVRHFYAQFEPWGLGRVTDRTPFPAEAVPFRPEQWTAAGIIAGFRHVIDAFDPHWVILTDSWNLKPVLVAACGDRPYILRLQALECLCPLNNVRLLPGPGGRPRQCHRHQLATPAECERCIQELAHTSGDLHRAERALAGVGTSEYRQTLFQGFAGAAAVLAVNPLTAAMVEPFARDVRVVTAGMDPARFPWPFPPERCAPATAGRVRILFAGLIQEWMKGFQILREACSQLWARRQDFEVVATDELPEGPPEPWARYVGWQSQRDLPGQIAGADIVVVPTVAQEALGRTAVEAMAAGKPVVASRLGGLPFTVADGATGLLCEPSNVSDLAQKLSRLLDDPELRIRLGQAGRRRFEEHYSWPAIIERHYRPLLGSPTRSPIPGPRSSAGTEEAPAALVVVSYYAGRPIEPLIRLLDSMKAFPAGAPHAVRIVVNRDASETITLPDRHAGIEVLYRPNVGYNIGAWEFGWRTGKPFPAYLFVQDECRVIRSDWVTAFLQAAQVVGVGMVGECESPDWDAPWEVLRTRFQGQVFREHLVAGQQAERVACYLDFFARQQIPPGPRGDHLQSLVLFASRSTLERVGGFPEGCNYGEAIAAEIGMSKKIQAIGLTLACVGPIPFHFIEHPQWLHRRTGTRPPARNIIGKQ